tara:strand:- start:592 stop:1110 length:519 start_codon:yes stop_codon:yes gene_type:complete
MIRLQEGGYAGIDTHKWKSFKRILKEIQYVRTWTVVDPFARNCPLANEWSNDINPETSAKFNLESGDFLNLVPSGVADLVIFDPPFSEPMAERKYGEGVNLYAESGKIGALMKQIQRVLKPNGILLKFGYNSAKHWPQLELLQVWLLNFGGNRNDVIVTAWKQTQTTLEMYS